ncbi:SH3 domain-containing protein [Cladobotryum mycophilum]|uniref:SH3 domain-containing protein n=1 Tax=Cladobotryum mycophilum TaxID=491253 RepID=A0ABR0SJ80_9HYPO
MSNPEKPTGGLFPEAEQAAGDFPPPPPGPPLQQSYQQPQQQPPAYEHGSYQQASQDEKQQHPQQYPPPPPPPQQPHQSQYPQQEQQFQTPPEQFYQQQPQNQQQQTPLQQTPTQQPQPQPQQQQAQAYSIPPYNPANPVFAPPPTHLGDEPSSSYQQPHQQQYQQQQPPSPNVPQGDQGAHGSHKPSWGERFSQLGMKAAAPINSLAHKFGSQSFLPETLDKECDKAAAILKAFCKKGVYADPGGSDIPTSTDPHAAESTDGIIDPTKEKPKSRVIVTIPPKVISKAVGLAIFTTLRAGYGVSGATGSGILVARLPDGSWSPPSGIQLHSVGGGLQIGLDIYDCVCVINSKEALAAFTDTRVSLGSDLAVVAGPYGAGAAVDFGAAVPDSKTSKKGDTQPPSTAAAPGLDAQQKQQQQQQTLQPPDKADKKSHRRSLSASATKPVFSYVKSRGFYAGIRVDGTVVAERKDANAAFYGQSVSVQQVLKGQVPPQGPQGMWPVGAQNLLAVLRGRKQDIRHRVQLRQRFLVALRHTSRDNNHSSLTPDKQRPRIPLNQDITLRVLPVVTLMVMMKPVDRCLDTRITGIIQSMEMSSINELMPNG